MPEKVAILLDGGFVKKKLQQHLQHFPAPQDVVDVCSSVMAKPRLTGMAVYRVFFYDAPPYEGQSRNPISGAMLNFSATPQAQQNRALIDTLELEPDFAVRRGEIVQSGWKLGRAALKSLANGARPITANDLVPDMEQKGVDIRIGLDIARIALKRLVDALVLVTGDSDFVPVMKFARTEGLKVYLETLGHPGIRRILKAHADLVL